MIVPIDRVAPETLVSIIEDWLSRQSQDWLGDEEDRQSQIDQVIASLSSKQLVLTWSDEMQTINIVPADSLGSNEMGI